jgi:hypothetical protein
MASGTGRMKLSQSVWGLKYSTSTPGTRRETLLEAKEPQQDEDRGVYAGQRAKSAPSGSRSHLLHYLLCIQIAHTNTYCPAT